MNGVGTRRGGYGLYDEGRLSPAQAAAPGGRAVVEGYRKDIITGFERDKPRFNPVRGRRRRDAVQPVRPDAR